MNIPNGYKLVPVEPTAAQKEAGCQGYMEADDNLVMHISSMGHAYRAMLAAAPTTSQPIYDEAKERELFEEWADEKGFCLDCEFFKKGNNYIDQATGWLYESWLACAQSRAKSVEVDHE